MASGQKVASLYAEIGADTSKFVQGANQTKSGLKDLQGGFNSIGLGSVASFLSITGAITGVGLALRSAINDTLAYGDQVRQLSLLSGTSSDAASRFIQVLDDYGLSTEDALTATRMLTRQGLVPSIDTLAKLSDQYLQINSAEERNDFILKNLGRGGAAWVEVLQRGSTALKDQAAATAQNLIVSKDQQDQMLYQKYAADDLTDSIAGLKNELSFGLIPTLSHVTDGFTAVLMLIDKVREMGIGKLLSMSLEERAALGDQIYTEIALSRVMKMRTAQMAQTTQATEDQKKAMQALTDANRSYLDQVDQMSQSDQSFTQQQQDLANQLGEAWKDVVKARGQGWPEMSGHMLDLKGKVQDLNDQLNDLADATELDMHRMELAMLENRLAADGELSDKEVTILENLGIKWGIYSQTAIDNLHAVEDEVNNYIGIIANIPTSGETNWTFRTNTIGVTGGSFTSPSGVGHSVNAPTATPKAEGGMIKKGGWTLVGDMPGGIPSTYSELIGPDGRVYNARETRTLLAMGIKPLKMYAGGVGYGDDPYGSPITPEQQAYNDAYYSPSGDGGGGGGGGNNKPPRRSGVRAISPNTDAINKSAAQTAEASQMTAEALQQQILASNQQNRTLISEIRNLRRDMGRALRDAVQTIA